MFIRVSTGVCSGGCKSERGACYDPCMNMSKEPGKACFAACNQRYRECVQRKEAARPPARPRANALVGGRR